MSIESMTLSGAFGACYSASSIKVAFAESVIHETGRFVAGRYEVARSQADRALARAFALRGAPMAG